MASPEFVFYLTCLLLGKMAHMTDFREFSSLRQEEHLVSANVGSNVTLRCFYEGGDVGWFFWYKQTLGQKPQRIASTYAHDTKVTFHQEFKDNSRFTVAKRNGINHLTIVDLRISDSATYYCAAGESFVLSFAEGTIITVKGSGLNVPALVQQSKSIQPGGSETLNCTVQTGTCEGEHRVYWFRNSEESHLGLIYTHGGSNDQCEKKPNTQTQTCVYNLPMKSLDLSHDGTYYCAVVSCGHILFGDKIKLDTEDQVDSLVLVYFLGGALAFTTILVVLLALSVYKMNKRNSCLCSESQARLSAPSTGNAEVNRDADSIHYAALSVNLPNRPRRPRNNTNDEYVYSSVKL